jgi:acyl carrier protein
MIYNNINDIVIYSIKNIIGDDKIIVPSTSILDLDIDSLSTIDIIMTLENEFGIQIPDDNLYFFQNKDMLISDIRQYLIDNYTIIDKNYERKLKLLNIKNNF